MTTTTNNPKAGFGKARLGNSDFYKRFRLETSKDGSATIFEARLMPPIKSQRETGKWCLYKAKHYGYRGRSTKDQTKVVSKDFECLEVKDFRTKIVKVTCPECDLIADRARKIEALEAKYQSEKKTEEEIKALLEFPRQWLKDHNVDRKWYINVMTPKGEFGVLAISNRCKTALVARLEELQAKDVDAFDLDRGVWFAFKRTGKGRDTVDTVDVVTVEVKVDGETVSKRKPAPLTDEQAQYALTILPDLNELMTPLTEEQVMQLINSRGDPDVVDAVFKNVQPSKKTPPRSVAIVEEVQSPQTVAVSAAASPTATATVPAKTAIDDEVKVTPPKTETPKVESAVKAAPIATAAVDLDNEPPTDDDDEAFIAQFKHVVD